MRFICIGDTPPRFDVDVLSIINIRFLFIPLATPHERATHASPPVCIQSSNYLRLGKDLGAGCSTTGLWALRALIALFEGSVSLQVVTKQYERNASGQLSESKRLNKKAFYPGDGTGHVKQKKRIHSTADLLHKEQRGKHSRGVKMTTDNFGGGISTRGGPQ